VVRRFPEMAAAQARALDLALRLQDGRADAGDAGFLHRQIDARSLACAVAAIERQQQRVGHVVAGGVIHVVVARPYRGTALVAGEVRHAARRIHGARTRARAAPRPGIAVGRAAQRDDARIDRRQALVIEAEAAHGAGAEVVRHHVALADELQEYFLP